MVDGTETTGFMTIGRLQSKIYAESNRMEFAKNPRDLTSMQILALYRGWVAKIFHDSRQDREPLPGVA